MTEHLFQIYEVSHIFFLWFHYKAVDNHWYGCLIYSHVYWNVIVWLDKVQIICWDLSGSCTLFMYLISYIYMYICTQGIIFSPIYSICPGFLYVSHIMEWFCVFLHLSALSLSNRSSTYKASIVILHTHGRNF